MSELNQNKTKKSGRGGARANAGRPKGSHNRITVESLLTEIERKTFGESYESLLIEDFLTARLGDDKHLAHKYHTLISNKIMATLNEVKVEEIGDVLEAKKAAFAEAIRALSTHKIEE